jgi:hypothetical protein
MAPSESSALLELTSEVRELRADLRVFQTKLMGDDKSEDDQGRIPRIEATLIDYGRRIKRGERFGWAARGAAWILGVIAGAIGTAYYIVGIARH